MPMVKLPILFLTAILLQQSPIDAFIPHAIWHSTATSLESSRNEHNGNDAILQKLQKVAQNALLAAAILTTSASMSFADDSKQYDGFADYAKDNQMEQSDVKCFINQCGDQTKALFSNPRGIKGVTCLGRCKGEQACATRCFAEYGSKDLNEWLSCTIEEHECVKVPKNVDNSAENVAVPNAVAKFDPSSLIGKWYKTDGLNPNYDLFDCQSNSFVAAGAGGDAKELDMGIDFRVLRPQESGGGETKVISLHVILIFFVTTTTPN